MLKPHEKKLIGTWEKQHGRIIPDAVSRRIDNLINEYLELVGKDSSGWDTLFRDPSDGRFWELVFPQSEMHGGGPPALIYLTNDEANLKYRELFNHAKPHEM